MRVVIVGLGNVGWELAVDLASRGHNELVLIDSNDKRCDQLASEIDALVLHGDGSNPELLRKARLVEADALVACTGSDAINTVIAMLGKHFKVSKIIVKLNGTGLHAACQEIGVSKIITPTISAAAAIMDVLEDVPSLDFALIERNGLQLSEMDIGNARGKHLSEVEVPDGGLIIAIQRGEQVLLARDQIRLQEGDRLLLLTESQQAVSRLQKRLEVT